MYEEMIKLERISKTFNTEPVLKGIDAELHAGEILGFLGPSGAGKTTTIKIITGQRGRPQEKLLSWASTAAISTKRFMNRSAS